MVLARCYADFTMLDTFRTEEQNAQVMSNSSAPSSSGQLPGLIPVKVLAPRVGSESFQVKHYLFQLGCSGRNSICVLFIFFKMDLLQVLALGLSNSTSLH